MRRSEVVRRVTRKLKTLYPLKRVWLFGSRAKKRADKDSDYYFLALVGSTQHSFHKRTFEVLKRLRSIGASIDLFIYTEDEFDLDFLRHRKGRTCL